MLYYCKEFLFVLTPTTIVDLRVFGHFFLQVSACSFVGLSCPFYFPFFFPCQCVERKLRLDSFLGWSMCGTLSKIRFIPLRCLLCKMEVEDLDHMLWWCWFTMKICCRFLKMFCASLTLSRGCWDRMGRSCLLIPFS